jgi:hypothetical protein
LPCPLRIEELALLFHHDAMDCAWTDYVAARQRVGNALQKGIADTDIERPRSGPEAAEYMKTQQLVAAA